MVVVYTMMGGFIAVCYTDVVQAILTLITRSRPNGQSAPTAHPSDPSMIEEPRHAAAA